MKAFWKFYRWPHCFWVLATIIFATSTEETDVGVNVSTDSIPSGSAGLSSSTRIEPPTQDFQNYKKVSKSSNEKASKIDQAMKENSVEKRHISSLLSNRQSSYHSDDKRQLFAPYDQYNDLDDEGFERFNDIDKRYFASLLKSEDIPTSLLTEKEKKHISSLMGSRYPPPSNIALEKRFYSGDEDQIQDDKRHIGSLIGNRYSYPGPSNYKRADVDSPMHEQDGTLVKRYLASLYGRPRIGHAVADPFSNNEVTEEKRHFSSLLQKRLDPLSVYDTDNLMQRKRYLASLLDDQMSEPVKKHLGSLLRKDYSLGKRYYASLLDNSDPEKRHSASLLDSGGRDLDKRYLGSLLRDGSFNPRDKKHLASLLDNSEDKMYLGSTYDKRYLGSLMDKRFLGSLYDKRYLGSLHDKRYLGSLYGKRYLSSVLDKRHIGSLYGKRHLGSIYNKKSDTSAENYIDIYGMNDLQNKLIDLKGESDVLSSFNDELMRENKRHIGSLTRSYGTLKGKRELASSGFSEELQKQRPFEDRNFNENDDFIDKRHIGSIRGRTFGKRFFTTLLRDENNNEDKRHISSIMSKREASTPAGDRTEIDKNDISSNSFDASSDKEEHRQHLRKKRYVGALAKNNNLPFRHSRGMGYSVMEYTPHINTYFDYIENYIREALKKESVRRRLLENEDLRFNFGDPRETVLPRVTVVDSPIENERTESENVYMIPDEVGYFKTPNKRFLGSLARQMWFPRPYRSFVDPKRATQSSATIRVIPSSDSYGTVSNRRESKVLPIVVRPEILPSPNREEIVEWY